MYFALLDMVRMILSAAYNVSLVSNARDPVGRTPLHLVCLSLPLTHIWLTR
jgi:hypothetical protein